MKGARNTHLLYLAGLATLVLGGSGPAAVDRLAKKSHRIDDGRRR
jgi:hypothetical protein